MCHSVRVDVVIELDVLFFCVLRSKVVDLPALVIVTVDPTSDLNSFF